MLKIMLLALGLAGGAAAATAWLLGERNLPSSGSTGTSPDSPAARIDAVRARVDEALTQGREAGSETERRLRNELEKYRKPRPA